MEDQQTKSPGLLLRYPVASIAAAGVALGFGTLIFSRAYANWIFGVTLAAGGTALVLTTVANMVRGRFNVDTIASLSIVGAAALGQYEAGALVVLMQAGGEALEDYGLKRAHRSLENLLRRAPSVAHRQVGPGFEEVAASALTAGDTILIRRGDIIAADGIVVEGSGNVDEAALTGEPVPLPKRPGDTVFSGTINLDGAFQVRTTSTAAHSKYELIVRMVQQAQGARAPINRLANRYAPAFTLITIVTAALDWAVTGDPVRALAVLVVATPCPLIIATPLAVLSALNSAAALNIIVKSGAAIEAAGSVHAVVFDKTGTLTVGEPALSEIQVFGAVTPEKLLGYAAAVELHSPHVFASAIVRAGREQALPPVRASETEEVPGTGVCGRVDATRVCVGSRAYVRDNGAQIPEEIDAAHDKLKADGKAVSYVAIDGILAGAIIFEDRVRPEAPALIERLKRLGIREIWMLTGDAEENARAAAAGLGIERFHARLLPDEKVGVVGELMRKHPVMMVGDGINDAPALAAATVGVAMGHHGAGIATDAADVVVTVENVERVADAIALGRRMLAVARQGILFGMGVSAILMGIASFGLIQPALGALLQEALDLATILNALRARHV